jgi:hypothetical protein
MFLSGVNDALIQARKDLYAEMQKHRGISCSVLYHAHGAIEATIAELVRMDELDLTPSDFKEEFESVAEDTQALAVQLNATSDGMMDLDITGNSITNSRLVQFVWRSSTLLQETSQALAQIARSIQGSELDVKMPKEEVDDESKEKDEQ